MPQTADSFPVVVSPGASAPRRAHADDAGLDLCAAQDAVIPAGGRATIPTGVSAALPAGTVGLVCPRSGLASRHGVTVLNGPGVVDAGYRGEIAVVLLNTDREQEFRIARGDRIAQLVIMPFAAVEPVEADSLEESERGHGGFGSTGTDWNQER